MPNRWEAEERRLLNTYATFPRLWEEYDHTRSLISIGLCAMPSPYQTETAVWLCDRVLETPDVDERLMKAVGQLKHWQQGPAPSVCWNIHLYEAHLQAWKVFEEVMDESHVIDREWKAAGCPARTPEPARWLREHQASAIKSVLTTLVCHQEGLDMAALHTSHCVEPYMGVEPFYNAMLAWMRATYKATDDCQLLLR